MKSKKTKVKRRVFLSAGGFVRVCKNTGGFVRQGFCPGFINFMFKHIIKYFYIIRIHQYWKKVPVFGDKKRFVPRNGLFTNVLYNASAISPEQRQFLSRLILVFSRLFV